MDNTWVLDVEPKVYTVIKAKTESVLKEQYSTLVFTSDNESNSDITNDYTVYIHLLEPKCVGNDLEGSDINGILATFEAQVVVNTNKSDCINIMRKILSAFKELQFDGTSLPVPIKSKNMYMMTARFRRVIAYGDTI